MRCAVLGSPVAHSLSPAMHRAAYAELGLDWAYEAIDVDERRLARFLADLSPDEWRGLSLTMPLKRVALALVDRRTAVAGVVGAVNTILLGTDVRLTGDNTDVPGAMAALREHGLDRASTARILGGGATATSVAYALAVLGATELQIVVRDVTRAEHAARVAREAGATVRVQSLEEPLLEKVDLLVSTVPGDVLGPRGTEVVQSARSVFDVAYDPWPSPLVRAAEAAGMSTVSGLDLLAHQAALQVELMTGTGVDVEVLRSAARTALTTQ
jgi:shikimate dehydrogenase